jgi:hypothetical protein
VLSSVGTFGVAYENIFALNIVHAIEELYRTILTQSFYWLSDQLSLMYRIFIYQAFICAKEYSVCSCVKVNSLNSL